jgi:hypothetical protein
MSASKKLPRVGRTVPGEPRSQRLGEDASPYLEAASELAPYLFRRGP